MVQINNLNTTNVDFLDEVIELCDEAKGYLQSFNWCEEIINGWVAKDWGYILCVFYFEIKPTKNSNADKNVWIVVGDIPPAYIDIESAKNVKEVLNCYVNLMEDWIENVNNNKPIDDCFPLTVAPTKKYAKMLKSRIDIIKEDFIAELLSD